MSRVMIPSQLIPAGHEYPIGIGLKAQHYDHVLEQQPDLTFFEVHAENYMMPGGAHHRYLDAIAERYRLSIHGVGMSLGSAEGLDRQHLQRFRHLVETYQPWLVSEHLAWSRSGQIYLNDLLPLPLTKATLNIVADNVACMQDAIGRSILVENPSSYLSFRQSNMAELDFLTELAQRTGCGLLLDVNNVFVSGRNMGWDVEAYLSSVPASLVGEIHLAGHHVKHVEGVELRIDDHGSRVCDDVWAHYEQLVHRIGVRPTLVEWDSDIPDLNVLLGEAHQARILMREGCQDIRHA